LSLPKSLSSRRPSEELRAQATNFVAEQDGPPERELKTKLVTLFGQLHLVRTAYLARVQYENAGPLEVVLCVRGQPGQDRMFANRIGEEFASMFGSHEHLDIIWITPEQEAALVKVCRPFYKLDAE
jgi:hypothetical protein